MGQEIEALMEMGLGSLGASGCSGSGNNDPRHGLKFGEKIYFGDLGGGNAAGGSSSGIPASPPASAFAPQAARPPPAAAAPKRGKGVVPGGQQQPPRCQVEGCRADLTGTKAYYCRHKVCGMHSKSPKVVVAGLEQRFCQQCSRFHQLLEFDQGKRSCRRRLAGHNERRRKPTAGTLKSRYGLFSSPFPDGGRFGSVLMDFSYPRLPTTPGEERGSSSQWPAAIDGRGGAMPNTTPAFVRGSAGATLFSGQEMQPSEGLGVTDSGCALSLLSTHPWGAAAAAATARVRAPTNSGNHYGGTPMAQTTGAVGGFMSNSWGFPGHGCSGAHEIPRVAGFRQVGGSGGGHSSGELELALQGDKQATGNAHGSRAYCAPGNFAHWSL